MVMIKIKNLQQFKSPVLAGLFCLFSVAGCQATRPPDEVSKIFWQAMTDKDLATARQHATVDSREMIGEDSGLPLQQISLQMGETTITGDSASVATRVTSQTLPQYREFSFDTLLLKQEGRWKVDYRRTLQMMPKMPLQNLIDNLRIFSEQLGRQFEQQLPLIEQFMQQFTEELNRQIEEFNRRFDRPRPEKKHDPYRNSI